MLTVIFLFGGLILVVGPVFLVLKSGAREDPGTAT